MVARIRDIKNNEMRGRCALILHGQVVYILGRYRRLLGAIPRINVTGTNEELGAVES